MRFTRILLCLIVIHLYILGIASAEYPYAGNCPPAGVYVGDIWNFYQCECVSYVAWKINQFTERSENNPLFTNAYQNQHWGSAFNWKSLVDNEDFAHFSKELIYISPSMSSYPWASYENGAYDTSVVVAWWNASGSPSLCGSGTDPLECGHVAFVEQINWNSDRTVSSILVSEYNRNVPHGKSERTINRGSGDYPDGFLYLVTNAFVECDLTGLCDGTGTTGGGGGALVLPDLMIRKIWLSDTSNVEKSLFRPGESIRIHIETKNVGMESPLDVDIDYFLSNGYKRDSNPTRVGQDTVDKEEMQAGEVHNEVKNITAPTERGTYNITAKMDPDDDIAEEHESNNWSSEVVFKVDDYGWLMPINQFVME